VTNPDSRQVEREAAAWLARRDRADWSAQDQSAFDAWLAEATGHRVAFLRLESAWHEAGRLRALGAGAASGRIPARREWAHSPYFASAVDGTIAETRHRGAAGRRWRVTGGIAAALLGMAVIAAGLAWWNGAGIERGVWRTALGAQQVVHLSDGSTATLDSDTELAVVLSRRERDLELVRGEAFFEVARDPSRPFVVHANGYRVTAVGTRFDVRRETDGLRVVVTHGLVRLDSAREPARTAAMLPAGSIATVAGTEVRVQHVPLELAQEYLSWREGYVVFHGTPLADAVAEFNRYNVRQIVIADPSLDTLRVGGNFRLDNGAAFVRLMQQVFPVRAEQRGDRIVLSRRSAERRD